MRTFVLSAFVALLAGGVKLETTYSTDKAVEVAIVFKQSAETSMSMERDGEPVEGMGGGSASSATEVSETYVDRYLEVADGKPTKVRRHWTEVSGNSSMSAGENSSERELESPFEGLVVEIDQEGEAKPSRATSSCCASTRCCPARRSPSTTRGTSRRTSSSRRCTRTSSPS
jgi:hypothetical protein